MSAREPDGKIDPLALEIENYLKRWDQGDNQRIKDLIADTFTRKLVGSLLGYVVLNTNVIMFTTDQMRYILKEVQTNLPPNTYSFQPDSAGLIAGMFNPGLAILRAQFGNQSSPQPVAIGDFIQSQIPALLPNN